MNAKYSAHIGLDSDGYGIELIVRKSIPGGIDGPFGAVPLDSGSDLASAERWLTEHGYRLTQPWQLVKAYDGCRLEAELVRA